MKIIRRPLEFRVMPRLRLILCYIPRSWGNWSFLWITLWISSMCLRSKSWLWLLWLIWNCHRGRLSSILMRMMSLFRRKKCFKCSIMATKRQGSSLNSLKIHLLSSVSFRVSSNLNPTWISRLPIAHWTDISRANKESMWKN